ncbi:SHOCT domain-containing protein [Limobrevibacterium gyesilva]|uniref:SHOCT domain-containing protein n=1 Tax=Limobrevibacterium gyesilva TaxID=2991712 RepID=A0AA42CGL8_9PROT|nr:SHOCT domain-containing protein [Limobrevibacterium gyesilva]MCW3474122.1 SHOCT domain-containing protein [Limobrevibacterium gyesilva]
MSKISLACLALAMLAAVPLAACGGSGSTSTTAVQNTTVSKGQQLIDLKKALDTGAISQSEYDAQRQKILAAP